jgi:hypothetical protein
MNLTATLTYEEQEAMREIRRNEPGTEPPCPFCSRPRVARTDYVRCNPCGVNWLDSEMHLPDYLNLDPRVARHRAAHTGSAIKPTVERPTEAADRR